MRYSSIRIPSWSRARVLILPTDTLLAFANNLVEIPASLPAHASKQRAKQGGRGGGPCDEGADSWDSRAAPVVDVGVSEGTDTDIVRVRRTITWEAMAILRRRLLNSS